MASLLTVIIAHNNELHIGRCAAALLRQEHAYEEHRVVIVDNASTDGTRSYLARLADQSAHVVVCLNDKNRGFGRAVNQAVRSHAKPGDDLLLLNPDCILPDGALQRMQETLGLPDAGIATLTLLRENGLPDPACARAAPDLRSSTKHAFSRRKAVTSGYHVEPARPGGIQSLEATTGALMLISRSCRRAVGDLDEQFWMYGEDLDYCRRTQVAGFKIYQAGDPAALHIKGASSGHVRRARVNYAFHHAMWAYYLKHLASRDPVPVRVGVLAAVSARGALSVALNAMLRLRILLRGPQRW